MTLLFAQQNRKHDEMSYDDMMYQMSRNVHECVLSGLCVNCTVMDEGKNPWNCPCSPAK